MIKSSGIILALDVDSFEKARHFVNKTSSRIKIFKVGSQLFTAAGPKVIDFIRKKKAEVFLDLKFFDIPNTVANAVRQAVRLKVKMLTLHICGGEEMLARAVEAAKDESRRLKIRRPFLIGVTVLTSQSADADKIFRLAKSGLDCGLDGIVCSPRETEYLRKRIKRDFIIVTPGIRAENTPSDDQKRTSTAKEAIAAGSDFLVVGRPILTAREPCLAIKNLLKI